MKNLFKKTLFLLALCGLAAHAQAQYVTIPDANFRAFLQRTYPACFNTQGQMDTTCTAIVTTAAIYCGNQNIANLEGIQYFDGLQNLDCQNNQLTSLPSLPMALQTLSCINNQLTSLPNLPASLRSLYCSYNQLTSLPNLPAILQNLDCQNNQLTSLPNLPANLQGFDCSQNQLTSLPSLPATLKTFYCSYNLLMNLPSLPGSLEVLGCAQNQLTSLPNLPTNLYELYCANNPLNCLPFLPNTLIFFNILSTNISCLPNIPPNLQNNTLPLCTPNNINGCLFSARIYGKVYQDFNINCISDGNDIPQKNIFIQAKNTATQELYTVNSDVNGDYELGLPRPATYELKAIFQNNYWTACPPQTITLTQNINQVQRDVFIQPVVQCADMEIDHQILNIARPCSTAVYKVAYFNSGTIASTGTFSHIILPTELALQSMTRPYTALGGGVFEVQLPTVPALERDTFSFTAGVSCTAVMNQMLCTEVEILPHTYCNTGTLGWDGSDITLSGHCVGQDSVRFIFKNIGNSPMSTSRTYWVIEDNVMLRTNNFQLGAGVSDSITVAADPSKIYRMVADEAPNNPNGNTQESFLVWGCRGVNSQIHWGFVNQFGLNNGAINPHNLCTPVRSSFDPNDISAVAEGTGPRHFILNNTDLEYKIRFQNTGNDTAFLVRVIDKLPAELDPTTLRIGAASHPMTYSLKANGSLEFLFQNILLTDSTSNEAHSHGFVTYKIKTKPNLAVGTMIKNKAFIYFDHNAPVATNIYTHTVGAPQQIFLATFSIENKAIGLHIFPNPTKGNLTIEIENKNENYDLQLVNAFGQTVLSKKLTESTTLLNTEILPQGSYFIYIFGRNGKTVGKFVKL